MGGPPNLLKIKWLRRPGLVPSYATGGASGLDVHAFLDSPVTIAPGQWRLIPTGFALQVPDGFEVQVRPRSGMALRHGITVLNSPGTVDSDYRGEVGIILVNMGPEPYVVEPGQRVAQLVVCPVVRVDVRVVEELEDTVRGRRGFGHSG